MLHLVSRHALPCELFTESVDEDSRISSSHRINDSGPLCSPMLEEKH